VLDGMPAWDWHSPLLKMLRLFIMMVMPFLFFTPEFLSKEPE
jgi:hypothetical protein